MHLSNALFFSVVIVCGIVIAINLVMVAAIMISKAQRRK